MPKQQEAQDSAEAAHDKARQLAEDALGAYAKGDRREGDRLAKEAKRLDRSAIVEVIDEIDEDAGSDPEAVKRTEC